MIVRKVRLNSPQQSVFHHGWYSFRPNRNLDGKEKKFFVLSDAGCYPLVAYPGKLTFVARVPTTLFDYEIVSPFVFDKELEFDIILMTRLQQFWSIFLFTFLSLFNSKLVMSVLKNLLYMVLFKLVGSLKVCVFRENYLWSIGLISTGSYPDWIKLFYPKIIDIKKLISDTNSAVEHTDLIMMIDCSNLNFSENDFNKYRIKPPENTPVSLNIVFFKFNDDSDPDFEKIKRFDNSEDLLDFIKCQDFDVLIFKKFRDLLENDLPEILSLIFKKWSKKKIITFDEDCLFESQRVQPNFRGKFDEILLSSYNYLGYAAAFRRSVFENHYGPVVKNLNDFCHLIYFNALKKKDDSVFVHLPLIGLTTTEMPAWKRPGNEELLSYFVRQEDAFPQKASFWLHRSQSEVVDTEHLPGVSVIICTRDGYEMMKNLVNDLQNRTAYPSQKLQIIIVNNQSRDPRLLNLFVRWSKNKNINVINYDHPFNYSEMHNLVIEFCCFENLLFLNNDIRTIHRDWLENMVRILADPKVGIVGAKLLYVNDLIQHAGVILGVGGVAGHGLKFYSRKAAGFNGRLLFPRQLSAVTAACLLTRKSLFKQVGGMDSKNLRVAFNDVDYCLKVRQSGYWIVWTPEAELYHLESITRGSDERQGYHERFRNEVETMVLRWGDELVSDPFYSPNLSLRGENFALAFPPRLGKQFTLD